MVLEADVARGVVAVGRHRDEAVRPQSLGRQLVLDEEFARHVQDAGGPQFEARDVDFVAAAGTLDLAPRESTVDYLGDQATAVGKNENRRRTDFSCRSVYLPVIRNDLPEVFDVFDFADPNIQLGCTRSKFDFQFLCYMSNLV